MSKSVPKGCAVSEVFGKTGMKKDGSSGADTRLRPELLKRQLEMSKRIDAFDMRVLLLDGLRCPGGKRRASHERDRR